MYMMTVFVLAPALGLLVWILMARARRRRPVPGMIDYLPNGRSAGNLQAICSHCGTIMNRRCAQSRIAAVLPNLDVTIRQG